MRRDRDYIVTKGLADGISNALTEMNRAMLMWIAAPMFILISIFTGAPYWVGLIGIGIWIFGWLLRPKGRRL